MEVGMGLRGEMARSLMLKTGLITKFITSSQARTAHVELDDTKLLHHTSDHRALEGHEAHCCCPAGHGFDPAPAIRPHNHPHSIVRYR